MLALLSSVGIRVWGRIAAVFAVGVALWSIFRAGKKAGADGVTAQVAKSTSEATTRMLDAAVEKKDPVDRLSKGTF